MEIRNTNEFKETGPTPFTIKPEESESVVDSGAFMHMLSKKDLNSDEGANCTSIQKSYKRYHSERGC